MLTIIYSVGGGGCGIRTHVTLLSNGFQDRLVMTASITLRVGCESAFRTVDIIPQKKRTVKQKKKRFLF